MPPEITENVNVSWPPLQFELSHLKVCTVLLPATMVTSPPAARGPVAPPDGLYLTRVDYRSAEEDRASRAAWLAEAAAADGAEDDRAED